MNHIHAPITHMDGDDGNDDDDDYDEWCCTTIWRERVPYWSVSYVYYT